MIWPRFQETNAPWSSIDSQVGITKPGDTEGIQVHYNLAVLLPRSRRDRRFRISTLACYLTACKFVSRYVSLWSGRDPIRGRTAFCFYRVGPYFGVHYLSAALRAWLFACSTGAWEGLEGCNSGPCPCRQGVVPKGHRRCSCPFLPFFPPTGDLTTGGYVLPGLEAFKSPLYQWIPPQHPSSSDGTPPSSFPAAWEPLDGPLMCSVLLSVWLPIQPTLNPSQL